MVLFLVLIQKSSIFCHWTFCEHNTFIVYIIFYIMDKLWFNFSLFTVYLYSLKFYAKIHNPLIDTFYTNPGYFFITNS